MPSRLVAVIYTVAFFIFLLYFAPAAAPPAYFYSLCHLNDTSVLLLDAEKFHQVEQALRHSGTKYTYGNITDSYYVTACTDVTKHIPTARNWTLAVWTWKLAAENAQSLTLNLVLAVAVLAASAYIATWLGKNNLLLYLLVPLSFYSAIYVVDSLYRIAIGTYPPALAIVATPLATSPAAYLLGQKLRKQTPKKDEETTAKTKPKKRRR